MGGCGAAVHSIGLFSEYKLPPSFTVNSTTLTSDIKKWHKKYSMIKSLKQSTRESFSQRRRGVKMKYLQFQFARNTPTWNQFAIEQTYRCLACACASIHSRWKWKQALPGGVIFSLYTHFESANLINQLWFVSCKERTIFHVQQSFLEIRFQGCLNWKSGIIKGFYK